MINKPVSAAIITIFTLDCILACSILYKETGDIGFLIIILVLFIPVVKYMYLGLKND